MRECFAVQQKEYCAAFNDQNIKMQIIINERDDLQKRMKVRAMSFCILYADGRIDIARLGQKPAAAASSCQKH